MAQPGKALVFGPTLEVVVTHNPVSNEWVCHPANPLDGAGVNNKGTVTFHVIAAGGCRVYTALNNVLANVFVGQSNNVETLPAAKTVLTLDSGIANTDITYCVCGPSDVCSPLAPKETGGYSIQVGNPPEPGNR